jgi:exonuclease III
VQGVLIGCLYLPNGNPAPGPKFDYKLRWFERLTAHAADNAYGRDAGLRIDHVLLSPSIAPRLKTAGVDRQVRGWEKASDHAPTWIDLADEAKRS